MLETKKWFFWESMISLKNEQNEHDFLETIRKLRSEIFYGLEIEFTSILVFCCQHHLSKLGCAPQNPYFPR